MASKAVVVRQKSSGSVGAIAETHGARIVEALVKMCTPHLRDTETMPDFQLVMTLFARVLEGDTATMVTKDEAHEAELADDVLPRDKRDQAATALYDTIVKLREILTGLYGGAYASQVFTGPTPVRDAVLLSRFASESATSLKTIDPPTAQIEGAKFDRDKTAEQIMQKQAELELRRKEVIKEEREAQVSLAAKNQAITAYDITFTGVATIFAGLLRLAGLPELADRVRPSSRRPGVTSGDEEEGAQDGSGKTP